MRVLLLDKIWMIEDATVDEAVDAIRYLLVTSTGFSLVDCVKKALMGPYGGKKISVWPATESKQFLRGFMMAGVPIVREKCSVGTVVIEVVESVNEKIDKRLLVARRMVGDRKTVYAYKPVLYLWISEWPEGMKEVEGRTFKDEPRKSQ